MQSSSLTRKPLYAPRGAVATSQPLAASAGLAVLRAGGNAVDAAIATATALTIVQPGSNDIGADLFAIVWDGNDLHGLNASGRSPEALTWDMAHASAEHTSIALGGAQGTAMNVMPTRGWLPVTVPGAPAGWRDLHERFGSRPFPSLFADAIAFAERGYPVSPRVADGWSRTASYASTHLDGPEFAEWKRVYLPSGRAPAAGERFANPAAARALRLIADSRAEAFYAGDIAHAMVAHAAATGGPLTLDDLAKHTSTWVDPISIGYRGHQVWELPPNGQGIAALAALGILDGFDFGGMTTEQRTHLQIEAMKLGFADAHAYVTDPEVASVPVAGMLDAAYLAGRRQLITDRAGDPPAGDPARGGTVYLCTADADGMMVSLIQSNYMGFGSFVAVPGFGFGLQNRGAGFSLDPAHPNVVAGGKRPFHTIIPGFLTRDGAAVGPFGVMGGHMQPQGHLQLMVSTIDDGLDPQAALDEPRWYWHAGRVMQVESSMDSGLVSALAARGHDVSVADNGAYGYGQAIWKLPDGAGYVAGSEGRADGNALGF
ncbi:MAG TPA: gamma-glutamyltransferase family protein [Micromonosporaceae bacterium]|nr:gamma-glutamyltransferase family protein [Micromonosporaceae bacterium]